MLAPREGEAYLVRVRGRVRGRVGVRGRVRVRARARVGVRVRVRARVRVTGATALMYSMSSSASTPADDRFAPTTVFTSTGVEHEEENFSRSRSSKNWPWNSATAIEFLGCAAPAVAGSLYRFCSVAGVSRLAPQPVQLEGHSSG